MPEKKPDEIPSIAASTVATMGSGVFVRVIAFFTSLLTRRILGPDLMGQWVLVYIVTGYLSNASTGIEAGSEPEIPLRRGRGDTEGESRIRTQMFTVAFLESSLVGTAFAFYLLARGSRYGGDLLLGLFCACLYVVIWRVMGAFTVSLRSSHRFVFLGKSQVAFALLDLALFVPLAYFFQLKGQYAAFGLGLTLKTGYWFWWNRRERAFGIRWRLAPRDMAPLLRVGFPAVLNNLAWQFINSIDSLVVAQILSTAALGYYSLGANLGRTLGELPTSLTAVLFPVVVQRFGTHGDARELGSDVNRYLRILSFLFIPALMIAAFFSMPAVTRQFLPQFTPAIPSLKILLFSAMFLPQTHLPVQIFLARKRMGLPLGLSILTGGTLWGVSKMLAPQGINVVALGSVAVHGAFFLTLATLALRATVGEGAGRRVLSLAGGLLYTSAVLAGVDRLISPVNADVGLVEDALRALSGMGLSALLLLPMFRMINKEADLLPRLKKLIS